MTTMSDLVEDVLLRMEGYTQDQNIYATLTSGELNASDTTFTTSPAVSPGLIEIGDELIYVGAVNSGTGVVSSCIRGFRRTPALDHASGALVVDTPRLPRTQVKRSLNETILSLGQRIGALRTYTFTADGGKMTYDVPSDCVEIRTVAVSIPGGEDYWHPSRTWRFDRSAGSPSASGRTVTLGEYLPGRQVRVTYNSYATELLSEQTDDGFVDDEFSDSGLPDWAQELVTLGACAKLATFIDAAGVIVRSGDQHALNGQVPWGSSMSLSKYLNALFESKVQEAAKRQRQEWDLVTHYQG